MQKYLKKKIRDERGVYIAVYAKTPQELAQKVAERTEEIERRKQLAENPLVWQYAQTWYKLYTPRLSDSRKSDYAIAINRHICPIIGSLHMLDVTPGDIADVMLSCADLSRSSQDKIVCALKKIFAAGEKAGVVRVNPCVDLRAGGKRAAEKEALTRQQMRTLEDAVAGTRIYPFVMIGLYAGLRREEILGLEWDCVHLDGAAPYISVRRALRWVHNQPVVSDELKSAAARRDVPIPPMLVGCLADQQRTATGDYVISSSDGQPWSMTAYRNAWRYITRRQTGTAKRTEHGETVLREKKLGETVRNSKVQITIDFGVTPHILRHTYITNLILSGANVKVVQYLAGHSKAEITLNIYSHLMDRCPEANLGAVLAAFPEQESAENVSPKISP
ncbi:MAG: tyrosine-type recombinase/integrase [Oscillospiraceae bacterium]